MVKNMDLKITQIRDKAKLLRQMETYEFEDDTTLKFYPYFADDMIEELVLEIQGLMKEQEELNANLKEDEDKVEFSQKMLETFINYMTIMHFTHLSKNKQKGYVKNVSFMNDLIKSGWYKKIIDEVFDVKQIYRVYEALGEVIGSSFALEKMMEKAQNQFEKLEIQNEEVFKGFAKGKK